MYPQRTELPSFVVFRFKVRLLFSSLCRRVSGYRLRPDQLFHFPLLPFFLSSGVCPAAKTGNTVFVAGFLIPLVAVDHNGGVFCFLKLIVQLGPAGPGYRRSGTRRLAARRCRSLPTCNFYFLLCAVFPGLSKTCKVVSSM